MARFSRVLLQSAALGEGLPAQAGTAVLLLHNGQPRTPFYAKQHLAGVARNVGFVPSGLRSKVADFYWATSRRTRNCVKESTRVEATFDDVVGSFVEKLQSSLATITPEFRPVNCHAAYLFDSPSIEERIDAILDHGADSLILIPLYPFNVAHLVPPLLQKSHRLLEARSEAFEADPSVRLIRNSHVSFDVSEINDLGSHESIIQFWAEKIRNNLDNYDSVIFATPLPLRQRSSFVSRVSESIKRTMYVVYDRYPRAVPWRLAFYPSWYQFWTTTSRQTIKAAALDVEKRHPNTQRHLVVPVADFFPSFDTDTILRSDKYLPENASLLPIEADDTALVHSVTEVVKNSLLTASKRRRQRSESPHDVMNSAELAV